MSKNKSNQMMCIGDPHGLHHHVVDAIFRDNPIACVLLGDQSYDKSINSLFASIDGTTAFHWIHGNHDTDQKQWYENLFHSPWCDKNLHARVEQIGDIRIAGLGGVFRGSVWHPDTGVQYESRDSWKLAHPSKKYAQKQRKHESSIWLDDYENLAKQRADILVTHEAPDCHRLGLKAISELAEKLGARLIVHGHHHRQYTDVLDNGIAVIGTGLAQVVTLDLDIFHSAQSAEDIIQGFSFGMVAKRGGGWLK